MKNILGETVIKTVAGIICTLGIFGIAVLCYSESDIKQTPGVVGVGVEPSVSGIPAGAVNFFMSESCPQGLKEVEYAEGRLILGVTASSEIRKTVGQSLGDQEERKHSHSYSLEVKFPSKNIAAIDCCNNEGAAAKTYQQNGISELSGSEIPLIQLPVCEMPPSADRQDLHGDAFPYGTISFFNSADCPSGWKKFDKGNGRFVVPLMPKGDIGDTVGDPLVPGVNISHKHLFKSSFSTDSTSYAGSTFWGSNRNVAESGNKSFSGATGISSIEIPYVNLMMCLKTANAVPGSIPKEAAIFFSAQECPMGWSKTLTTGGRFLVGLPKGGDPGASFGGSPLIPKENRNHSHKFSGTISTNSGGVGLASGCCADGFAKNKSYDFSVLTEKTSTNIPYIQLIQCQKD